MTQFNRFLPEEPLVENDDFIIYGNNDLEIIKEDIMNYLLEKNIFYLTFLNSHHLKE